MAKKRQEDPPSGSPAWMATFSDLMNLLLCFFVLLFSMSTVDAQKFELVLASLRSSFSVLPSGGSSVGEGAMINSGMNQMEYFDVFYQASENTQGNVDESEQHSADATEDNEDEGLHSDTAGGGSASENESEMTKTQDSSQMTEEEIEEAYEQQGLEESEEMAEDIEEQLDEQNIASDVAVDFNSQYVVLTLNGALLFESGSAELMEDAYTLVDRVGIVLESYDANIIDIEGHTDNVPIHNELYANNNVLSAFRAINVMEYLVDTTKLKAKNLKASGRGENDPVADNATAEGRAKNRRVEIKIYNSLASAED